jgi:ADP-ribosylglycohydrolase
MHSWISLNVIAQRVRDEIDIRAQQGSVTSGLLERWEQARDDQAALLTLHADLKSLPQRPGWPYEETSTLETIRQARPGAIMLPPLYLSPGEIYNKIHGAWLGRAAGCVLGKPLEMGMDIAQISDYLAQANALPLDDFVPAQSRYAKILRRDCAPSMRGLVRYAQEDDDLNYMCLAVKLLEKHGRCFTTLDVGMNWLHSIPFCWTWGPEHVVYLNLALAYSDYNDLAGLQVESLTDFLNPHTEAIGAQIRADVFGYVCPNNPELAAEFAWRDAYLTHRASGIYGAMWVAAMNAAAFTLLDMEAIIRAGLAQIPARSRFTEAVLQTIEWVCADGDWRKTGERIAETYGCYGFAGAIDNACCVTAGLLYGWGDGADSPAEIYERTITTTVQLAFDTDCNGATAGSVVGMVLGADALPAKWIAPLNDTMRTCVAEFGQVSIAEMARRCQVLSQVVAAR